MALGEVNTQILTLVMVDVFIYHTLPKFSSISFKIFQYQHLFTSRAKHVYIKISWILRSQLIWFYTVSEQDILRVYHGKVLLIKAEKINGKMVTFLLYNNICLKFFYNI